MSQLTQDDFRKLLSTPRPPGDVAHTSKPHGSKSNLQKRDHEGFVKPFPKPKSHYKPKYIKDNESESSTNHYRDRAKERREGTNKDYADSEAMLAILEASTSIEGSALHAASLTQTPNEQMLRDQTKYLGGDVNHTHLVKGLDKALLEKVRKEIGKSNEEKTKEEDAIKYVESLHGEVGSVEFNSNFAELIYTYAIQTPKNTIPLRNDLFLSGRMAFSWDLGLGLQGEYIGSYSADIPTTVIRSKADVKDFDRKMQTSGHEIVIEKIAHIMQMRGLSHGVCDEKEKVKKRRKSKPNEKAAENLSCDLRTTPAATSMDQLPPSTCVDDDDIFGGVGRDYELQVDEARVRKAESALSNSTKLKLFNNNDDVNLLDYQPSALDGINSILKQSAKMVDGIMGDGSASKMVEFSKINMEEDSYIPKHQHNAIQPKKRVFGATEKEELIQQKKNEMDLDSDSDGEIVNLQMPMNDASFKSGLKQPHVEKGEKNDKKTNKKAKFNTEFSQLDKIMKNKYGQGLGQ